MGLVPGAGSGRNALGPIRPYFRMLAARACWMRWPDLPGCAGGALWGFPAAFLRPRR